MTVMMTSSNGNSFRVTALCAGNSPVPGEFSHKGQWRGALMFSLIWAWINGWVNNPEAGDLRRHPTHCDVIVMSLNNKSTLIEVMPWCRQAVSHYLNQRWPNSIWCHHPQWVNTQKILYRLTLRKASPKMRCACISNILKRVMNIALLILVLQLRVVGVDVVLRVLQVCF